jgi:hypothetical protein
MTVDDERYKALHDAIPRAVHACLDYDLTPEECYRATPCGKCSIRRDEHADQPVQSAFPALDITGHTFAEPAEMVR